MFLVGLHFVFERRKKYCRMTSKKKIIQPAITSMLFPLLKKSVDICTGRQINVPGSYWTLNRDRISHVEAHTIYSIFRVANVLESTSDESSETGDFDPVTDSDEIRR